MFLSYKTQLPALSLCRIQTDFVEGCHRPPYELQPIDSPQKTDVNLCYSPLHIRNFRVDSARAVHIAHLIVHFSFCCYWAFISMARDWILKLTTSGAATTTAAFWVSTVSVVPDVSRTENAVQQPECDPIWSMFTTRRAPIEEHTLY